ncbi:MAG: RNA-binding domain-containing protein [Candidatus Sulfotelmatobacter sp.]
MPDRTIAAEGLPFNLDDLIHTRAIESNRIEFKSTWNSVIRPAVLRTICAFSNDLLNLNGGYAVLGVEEQEGRPVLPPAGLDNLNLDSVQREIRGACKNLRPDYQPVLFPVQYEGKWIIVIWCPAGDNRPYQAPEDVNLKGSAFNYYVRQGPETVQARGETLRQLLEAAAKTPFDDRRSLEARVEDISPTLTRRFLNDIRSDLILTGLDDKELYRRLRIVTPVNAHEVPRNVALLFFNEDPDRFFRGARIEVVQFGDDSGGDLIEERVFKGPLQEQVKLTLDYLNSMGGALLQKVSGQAEVERTVAYPYEAMEEAIVNAVYHRSYEAPPEPVKVYLYPDRMEIISYPGPAAGIRKEHFLSGHNVPAVPARNRRIGEFLKELRLAEGRGTGIPKIRRKMMENGSPSAQFNFDEERTFFQVILPVHPRYEVLHALREAGSLWAIGERKQSIDHLRRAYERQPGSGALATQLIEYGYNAGDENLANETLALFEKQERTTEAAQPFLAMARILLDRSRPREAAEILNRMPLARRNESELIEAGILRKKLGDFEGAHHALTEAFALNPDNVKTVHELAQTKSRLARNLAQQKRRGRYDPQTESLRKKLHSDCEGLLRRALQLADDPIRRAWCWHDLAWTLDGLRQPENEIEQAFLTARTHAPHEQRIQDAYDRWKNRRNRPISNRNPRRY